MSNVRVLRQRPSFMYALFLVCIAATFLLGILTADTSATIYDIELKSNGGQTITGQVDTTTDTFTIDSWTNNAGAKTWTPVPSSLPWAWPAVTGGTCDTYDTPDDWDCTIGDDWGFIDASDLKARQWEQGTFRFDIFWSGWGGKSGFGNRCGGADYSGGEGNFYYLPTADSSTTGISFTKRTFTPPVPAFDKTFSPDAIASGGTSTLTFSIENNASVDATSLDFTDNLPAGVVVADPANASTDCIGGTLTAAAGSGVISYTGGSMGWGEGGYCTVQVDVTSSTPGNHDNTSGDLTSSLGNSGTASDTLTVYSPPAFTKTFSPDSIASGGTSTLTFVIENNASVDATDIDFTDNLPAGVVVADPANASTDCIGGTLTAAAGSGVISYTGGSMGWGEGGYCTVQVDVTSSTPGNHDNTSGDLTSSLGNSGTASDTLTVGPQAPTATAATAVEETGFSANWDATGGADGYYLDVATDNGFTDFVPGYNNKDVGNKTTFSVNGLSAATQYFYRVRAENSGGVSENSNVVSVITKDGTGVPDAVQDAAPNNGDGNGDGIRDCLQENVASLPSAAPGKGYLTVAVSGCAKVHSVATRTYASIGDVDAGHLYPFDLVEFRIPCNTATVRVYYHGASSLNQLVYRKYGPTPDNWNIPIWYNMPNVTFGSKVIGGKAVLYVEYQLNVGELGDDTPGLPIIDPGGLARVNAIPTLNEWGAMIMALLTIGTAVLIMRKRRNR